MLQLAALLLSTLLLDLNVLPSKGKLRHLGSCEALFKRVCRRKQIQRWTYRQVSSKLIKIQHLCNYMAHVSDAEQKARIQQKIKQLTLEYLEFRLRPIRETPEFIPLPHRSYQKG
ncbi:hypothetical protein PsorP6_016807 [Peronosclerospora sorghi]|uniref:Uncharacterized protein n=1 Tax=Peronosclerospora sorghi TaxID=230839 RepID=A0ACC0WCD3_9STRA|nr:hypothetical protein PsorP6_016807 [Peronosclerospora sorghi]